MKKSFVRFPPQLRPPYRRRTPVTPEHQRITGRDEVIERRGRFGDLEGDTVLGPPGTGGVLTLVDRLSRFLLTRKVHCKEASHVATQLVESLNRANLQTVKSITFDNGTEFADCPQIAERHGFGTFFVRAGAPYQRGTNENTNGLLRQNLPKGTRFDLVTAQQLAAAATLINNRPRRCLGYKTPAKVVAEHSNKLRCTQIRDRRRRTSRSDVDGVGIFATQPIARLEMVAVWGAVYTAQEVSRFAGRFPRFDSHTVMVADGFYLGSSSLFEFDDVEVMNRSCEPNVGVQGQIVLVARRDISVGEELTFDYDTTETSAVPFDCRCGSPLCRGTIDGSAWQDPAFVQRNAGFLSWHVEERLRRDRIY